MRDSWHREWFRKAASIAVTSNGSSALSAVVEASKDAASSTQTAESSKTAALLKSSSRGKAPGSAK